MAAAITRRVWPVTGVGQHLAVAVTLFPLASMFLCSSSGRVYAVGWQLGARWGCGLGCGRAVTRVANLR